MQIREQGKQVQLIRSVYDKSKKRNIASVVAHIPRYSDEKLSDEVLAVLTDDERKHVEAWLTERATKSRNQAQEHVATYGAQRIDSVTEAVPRMTQTAAQATWEAIARLQKALRKAGHKRLRLGAPGAEQGS